jgi:hypothetical protein
VSTTTATTADTAAPAEAFSPAAELREAFWRLKRSRIRVSSARSTRAGSIGNDCSRFIFYERTAGDMRTPHSEQTQALFDRGNQLEVFVIHELEAMGVEVVHRQRDYLDREYEIGARADVKIRRPGWPNAVTSELKGLNPHAAEAIETLADVRDSRHPWIRRYYSQLQTYLHFDGGALGLFTLLNKSSGQITFIECPRDQDHIDALLAKAAVVRDAIRANEPPPRNESEECLRCPFLAVCAPGRSNPGAVQVLDGTAAEEAAELIARRLDLAEARSEFDGIDRRLKKLLPEVPELLVGDFMVKAKQVSRPGYIAASSNYWQRSYARIGGK